MNVFKTSLLATALIAGGVIAPAHAVDSAPMDFKVTITIDKSCDIKSTTDVTFGTVFASAGTATTTATTNGSVTVQCTVAVPYSVALNGGLHSGGDINARKMQIAAGTDTIGYQLYQDNAGSAGVVWGETVGVGGVGGDTDSGVGAGFGSGVPFDQIHAVHAVATIPGTAPVGSYSDTITATIKF